MASAPPSQSARFAGALEDPDAPASARLAGAASGVALRNWHFGRIVVPGPDYDWDDQLEGTRCRRGVVARPGIRTLVEWAETCLDTNPLGGWSPGRSIAVTVEYHDDTDDETLYYALFDSDLIQVKEVPGSTSAHGWPAPTLWGLVWDDFLTVLFQLELQRNSPGLVFSVASREIRVWNDDLCLEFAAAVHRPVPSADPDDARDELFEHCRVHNCRAIQRAAKLPDARVFCLFPELVLQHIACSRRAGAAMLPSA